VPGSTQSCPIIRFVGRSGSGKTTLVSKLVAHWTRAGLRVGALKHASKAFQMDRPGKDTYRFRASGAAAVAVASPTEFAVVASTARPAAVEDLVAHLPRNLDVIVVEGYKGDGGPAVEVHRGTEKLLGLDEQGLPGLMAIATDRPGSHLIDLPQLDIDDVAAIARFLEDTLGVPRPD